jgi:hypothetical protein
MFKLDPCPEFSEDVKLSRPGEEPGVVRFRFRHKTREQFKAWMASAKGRKDSEYLLEVVAGWEGVGKSKDEPTPFSAEAFAELINKFPASGQEIFAAYGRALHESRTGN